MFDVLKTLASLTKPKKSSVKGKPRPVAHRDVPSLQHVAPAPPQTQQKSDVEIAARIAFAETQGKEIILEAKDAALRIRRDTEDEMRRKLESLDRREGAADEREKRFTILEETITKKLADIEKINAEALAKLENVSHLTLDEAKKQIIEDIRVKLKEEIAREIRQATASAQEEAQAKAREILVDAMRHGATDYVPEYTVSIIKITDEEIKGRIIGKEGRNIRAFETVTGVDVDLDEEGVIRLSCFDAVRREIARMTLERLLRDGRVQPGRIEELVGEVKKEIERIMFEEGQKLAHAVGVYNLPAPLIALLGRFKYRSSYGQNMIAHTLEETKIGIALAHETGADVNVVRLGCLLHDIGKIVTDAEGSHVGLGVELLQKYGIPQNVIDCVAQHHEDMPFSSSESVLVYVADAISGSRPGARHEDVEQYAKRLREIETIAKAHEGVRESYAFQAGRELRVIVDPGKVDDATATMMALSIKNEIEKKLTFPGQIKITVIRELRVIETAK